MGDLAPSEWYRRLKTVPNGARKVAHEALVGVFEQWVKVERRNLAEQSKRFAPVYDELRAVVQRSAEMKGVLRALASLGKLERPVIQPYERKILASKKPIFRMRGPDLAVIQREDPPIQLEEPPPFIPYTWYSETGPNLLVNSPTANGDTGDMSFYVYAGITDFSNGTKGEGSISCVAGVFVNVSVPFAPGLIEFKASPSFNWFYGERSTAWFRSTGSLWIGQSVGLWDKNGGYLGNPIATQNILASFDDTNLSNESYKDGASSAYSLYSSIYTGPEADGGWISYGCLIGASCSANGNFGGAEIQCNANCNDLIIDFYGPMQSPS